MKNRLQASALAWHIAVSFLLVVALGGAFTGALLLPGADVLAQDETEVDDAAVEEALGVDHSDIVVDPSLWVLDFDVKRVRTVSLLEGPFKGKVFWYMVYTVENSSEEDRSTMLSVTASSDRGKRYVDTALRSVEQAVERKVGRPLWGRTDLVEAQKERDPADRDYHYTTFAAGEKRECVAVFDRLDPGANYLTITVRGLSNDFHLVTSDDGSREIEERVYEVRYERPEDPYEIGLDSFIRKTKGWVKRRIKLSVPDEGESDA